MTVQIFDSYYFILMLMLQVRIFAYVQAAQIVLCRVSGLLRREYPVLIDWNERLFAAAAQCGSNEKDKRPSRGANPKTGQLGIVIIDLAAFRFDDLFHVRLRDLHP